MENTDKTNGIAVRRFSELYTECSQDYLLPDYKGDVKRILHTDVNVLQSGCFRDADAAEITGTVAFDVLYLSSENLLDCVSFTAEYCMKAPLGDEFCEVFADCSVENASVRLPGPRKMSARCTVKGNVRMIWQSNVFAEGTGLNDECRAEVLKCGVKSGCTFFGKLKDKEFEEELVTLSGAAFDDVCVLAKRGEVRGVSVACLEDAVTVAGEVDLTALVRNADAVGEKELRIPFEERIEMEGVTEGAEAFAKGRVASFECRCEATEDGVRVGVFVTLDVDVSAYKNQKAEILTDAYSPLCEVENKYERLAYEEFVAAKSKSTKITHTIPKSQTDAECAKDIVYLTALAHTEGAKVNGSEVAISGEVRFSGVACEIYEDGTPTYTSVKFTAPFEETVNLGVSLTDDAALEFAAECFDARVTLDENNFYVECGLCISACAFAKCEITRLVSCEALSEPCESVSANAISVYYPDEGDTLFEVAKRFKTSPMKIAADNALTEDAVSLKNTPESLSSVKKLMIKRF